MLTCDHFVYQCCVECVSSAKDLFAMCRRAGGSGGAGGGMGPMGGPMDFARNKSKFQEVPETGITFDDVAVSASVHTSVHLVLL